MPYSQLVFCTKLFSLHSRRSIGATGVDDAGVNDGLVKCHGRSPSHETEDADNLIAVLSVS